MERNKEMIQKLKDVKSIMVSRELRGDDWDDMQAAVSKLEEVVSYINDCSGKGIEFLGTAQAVPFLIIFS